jgi:DNA-binding CsgD family transcriptional regulator/PAS domain-containing protein
MKKPDLLTAIDVIYASALVPERWPEALEHIGQLTGGLGAAIVPLTATDRMVTIGSSSLDEATQDYNKEWWRYDIRVERRSALGITEGLITDPDLLDEETARTHPFFQEFLRSHKLGAYLGYVMALPSGQMVAVGLHRDVRRGPFEKEEKDSFTRLAPHAARALVAGSEIAEGRRAARILGSLLNHSTSGIILLDDRGEVVSMTETARSMLGSGLDVSRRRLKAITVKDQKALDALVASALPGRMSLVQPPLVLSSAPSGERKLLVQAIPVGRDQHTDFEHLTLKPGVLLLLNGLSTPASDAVLERLIRLGLTRGQARIAAAVGGGLSSKEAAEQLGLTDGTIRTVLKVVYERLDLTRQSQLVALVTKLGSLPAQT